jgi:hypothetical protein
MYERLLETCSAAVILCVAMLGETVIGMPLAVPDGLFGVIDSCVLDASFFRANRSA